MPIKPDMLVLIEASGQALRTTEKKETRVLRNQVRENDIV